MKFVGLTFDYAWFSDFRVLIFSYPFTLGVHLLHPKSHFNQLRVLRDQLVLI
jgi:hypothetical protein